MKLIEARENDNGTVEIRLSFSNEDIKLLRAGSWASKTKEIKLMNLIYIALRPFELPEEIPKQPETKEK
jgi:hypothetical protein